VNQLTLQTLLPRRQISSTHERWPAAMASFLIEDSLSR
jgi:hypothetical protein